MMEFQLHLRQLDQDAVGQAWCLCGFKASQVILLCSQDCESASGWQDFCCCFALIFKCSYQVKLKIGSPLFCQLFKTQRQVVQPEKSSLFGNSRRITVGDMQTMVDNRQVQRTKEERSFIEERGELRGAGFEQKSTGGNQSSGFWWLLIGGVVLTSYWLDCCWASRRSSFLLPVCQVSSCWEKKWCGGEWQCL